MKVRVVFYGGLKQEIGAKEQVLEFGQDALRFSELVGTLEEQYPRITPHLETVAYVVGHEIVEPDYLLHDGDEAALLPPVSGG